MCYKIGFGVPKHEGKERRLLINDSQTGAIEDQIQLIKESAPQLFQREGSIDELHSYGFVNAIDFPQYYREKGLLLRAREVYEREIQDTKEIFGKDHWLTLLLRSQLGFILKNQGQWKKAKELEVQVMETRKSVFGEEHLDTLISMAKLASIYIHQKRWKETEELEVQIMETSKRVFGIEHPSTLISMAILASTSRNQER